MCFSPVAPKAERAPGKDPHLGKPDLGGGTGGREAVMPKRGEPSPSPSPSPFHSHTHTDPKSCQGACREGLGMAVTTPPSDLIPIPVHPHQEQEKH